MRFRYVLIGVASVALFGTPACSTTGSADESDQTETAEQAQSSGDEETDKSTSETRGEQTTEETADESGTSKGAEKEKKMAGMCPMEVDGTQTSVEKLDGAVAMDFTTDGDVDELRSRVQKMREKHGKHHGDGGKQKGESAKKKESGAEKASGEGTTHEKTGSARKMKELMAKSTTETEEIEGGIRLSFAAEDSAHLDEIHGHLKEHSEMMAEGKGCPIQMMKGKKAHGQKKSEDEEKSEGETDGEETSEDEEKTEDA